MPCARWPRSSRVYPQSRARNIPAREGWVLGPGERPPSYTAFHYGRNVPHRPLSGDRPSRHGRFFPQMGTGLAFFSGPRSAEEDYPLSQQPSTTKLSTFGTLAGLQSQLFEIILTAPESLAYAPNSKPRSSFFVLTPWCATMKANRKAFQGTETPNPLRIQRFQDHATPSLSTKRLKKTAPFSAVSGQRASRTHCNRGATE